MTNHKELTKMQSFLTYIGGSTIQTVLDNPITSYRQLIQQYAKDTHGNMVDPKLARQETNKVFIKSPIAVSVSGLGPRLFGISVKSIPKFSFFWGITALTGAKEPGMIAAIGASIFSSCCINPIRMIEKQQRVALKNTGKIKPVIEILQETRMYDYKPLFRGIIPLMGHSIASATTGLIGQPKLQKYIQMKMSSPNEYSFFSFSKSTINIIASALVSPIYVFMTNPLARLEVIMQTNPINAKNIKLIDALKELKTDSQKFGLRGMFRGQGVGIGKAIVSLSLFHEGRMFTERLISI